jgi:crotonobetainyl-CoA:carnitine CoA-transferase CaiB-like acyl-CoA transferase
MSHVLADPQLAARGMWHPLVDRDGRRVLTAGTPFRIDGEKPALQPSWPRLGEHTEEVRNAWLKPARGVSGPMLPGNGAVESPAAPAASGS